MAPIAAVFWSALLGALAAFGQRGFGAIESDLQDRLTGGISGIAESLTAVDFHALKQIAANFAHLTPDDMMVMLSKQSPDMFDKVKRLENAFNETIGALPKDAQELANKITDLLKVFDAILPEEMNLLVIARVAFDALSSFHNLTTEGRQAFDKSFPRVTAFIEDKRFQNVLERLADETPSSYWDMLN